MVQPSDFFDEDAEGKADEIEASGMVWIWRPSEGSGATSWFFLTIAGEAAEQVRVRAPARRGGFGSVPVEARIGATIWRTSLFPSREAGSYLLPLKVAVRRAEALVEGSAVTVVLRVGAHPGKA
jgi:hypothetical protein